MLRLFQFYLLSVGCLYPPFRKEASVKSDKLWKATGKPRDGPIFANRQTCRLNIVNVLETVENLKRCATLMTYTRPYCRRIVDRSSNAGAQNLTTKISVLRWMVALMLILLHVNFVITLPRPTRVIMLIEQSN